MTPPDAVTTPTGPAPRGRLARLVRALLRMGLVLAVVSGGALGAVYFIRTGPKAGRRKPERRAQLVEVQSVQPASQTITIEAMGTVAAARAIDLQPQVSGRIVAISPECIPGGCFRTGDVIARIDADDYGLAIEQQQIEVERLAAELAKTASEILQRQSAIDQAESQIQQAAAAIAQRASDIVQADAALQLERGQQAVAKREYELLGSQVGTSDHALMLREPQLRSAEAACAAARAASDSAEAAKRAAEAAKRSAQALKQSAEASRSATEAAKAAAEVALRKARLDLARAELRAPFNAIVDSEAVDLGSQVSAASTLARLVGTDEYWIEVAVPVDQLKWIRIPRTQADKGSPVRVFNDAAWSPGASRTGTVVRLASSLEKEGRMARLLVAVHDPLGLDDSSGNSPALLIGSYVRAEIQGATVNNVVPLPRQRLRDGDRVWVMAADDTLDIRPVGVAFRGRERVLVASGIEPGDRLVTSDLAAPVQGMALRVGQSGHAQQAPATHTALAATAPEGTQP